MLIIGAKGFAKEVLEVCHKNKGLKDLCFYDDLNADVGDKLFNQFPVLKNLEQAKKYFNESDDRYTIGIGNPILRFKMYQQFSEIGGELTSTISNGAMISTHDVYIGQGCNILSNSVFSNGVKVGNGTIVYYHVTITHDCTIGNFVEISPSVNFLGNVIVGDFSQIGSGTIILPKVKIGQNVTVGAGSIVTKDVPDNSVVLGSPARIIKQNTPLNFVYS